MAEFQPAHEFTLDDEDPHRLWKTVPDLCPEGVGGPCHAISGINSGAWPEEFAAIDAIPQADRATYIFDFYESRFWTPMGLAQIDSQDIANRVHNQGVWGGPVTAIKLLQRAINTVPGLPAPILDEDGHLGPLSLSAVNSGAVADILKAYRAERETHLRTLRMFITANADQQAGYLYRARR